VKLTGLAFFIFKINKGSADITVNDIDGVVKSPFYGLFEAWGNQAIGGFT